MINFIRPDQIADYLLNNKQIDQMVGIVDGKVRYATLKITKNGTCKMSIWTVDEIDDSCDVYSFPFSDPDDPSIDIFINYIYDLKDVILSNGLFMDDFVEFPGLQYIYKTHKSAQQADAPEPLTRPGDP